MAYVFAYITCPSENEAKKIGRHLLENRLIGCANIFPIASVYPWEGKITEDREAVLIAKTTEKTFGAMRDAVLAMHPYDVPCITKIPVEPNQEYGTWLEGHLGQRE